MKSYLQKIFINLLVKHLFKFITERDILQVIRDPLKGKITVLYRGKELSQEQVYELAASAELFKNNNFWKMLSNEVMYRATEKMFYDGRTGDDLLGGKSILFCLGVIQKKIDEIVSLRKK